MPAAPKVNYDAPQEAAQQVLDGSPASGYAVSVTGDPAIEDGTLGIVRWHKGDKVGLAIPGREKLTYTTWAHCTYEPMDVAGAQAVVDMMKP